LYVHAQTLSNIKHEFLLSSLRYDYLVNASFKIESALVW